LIKKNYIINILSKSYRKRYIKTKITIIVLLFINFNVFAQWQQLNGPPGGQIRSILYDGSTIFAGGSGGVLESDDQGVSWTFRNENLTSCDIKSFVQLGGYNLFQLMKMYFVQMTRVCFGKQQALICKEYT